MMSLWRLKGFQLSDLRINVLREELDDVVIDALLFHDVGQAFDLRGKAAQFQGEHSALVVRYRQRRKHVGPVRQFNPSVWPIPSQRTWNHLGIKVHRREVEQGCEPDF